MQYGSPPRPRTVDRKGDIQWQLIQSMGVDKIHRFSVERYAWRRFRLDAILVIDDPDGPREERRLLELTMRVVEKVRSFLLVKLVSRIVDKLCESMESKIFRLMRTEGRSLAEKLSIIAEAWGNRAAKSWATDRSFIQYLTVNNLPSIKT